MSSSSAPGVDASSPTPVAKRSVGDLARAAVSGWLGTAHRCVGFTAFALSLPVAAYCLYGFGFAPAPFSARTLVHSLAGCLFYGAYAAKMLALRLEGLPPMVLPLLGGTVLASFVLLCLTAVLWFFTRSGLPLV